MSIYLKYKFQKRYAVDVVVTVTLLGSHRPQLTKIHFIGSRRPERSFILMKHKPWVEHHKHTVHTLKGRKPQVYTTVACVCWLYDWFRALIGCMAGSDQSTNIACNDTSAAFLPALRSSAWMPQIPGALPHFNWFTAACFHKKWTTVDWRVSNGDSNTPYIQLNSWWISLVQPLKLSGPTGLHFGLLCQDPTTLCSNCCTPRDGLGVSE